MKLKVIIILIVVVVILLGIFILRPANTPNSPTLDIPSNVGLNESNSTNPAQTTNTTGSNTGAPTTGTAVNTSNTVTGASQASLTGLEDIMSAGLKNEEAVAATENSTTNQVTADSAQVGAFDQSLIQ